ncbi:hypothetical protein ASC77_17730 [Nocardioides sp. Root1257]|uniref:bifunctional glycosyltransferase/CDP-glycerol:glycerophosphate glycerophosphotransferase n=1 Tax=unclassified Nocardioides TaxID=2615069 RepID=UPI0006F29D11|nr:MULTISPECIES: CDP-glycerol glycerophosphotransferase family protein [unclassified Nocardioides]KQW47026.1 hypothetical protein ASC77_17730 [Nocardioides sp. Root1257]KRC43772.1 hypothetical protein ASE24_18685 [Nocardioides sp. Root224]
MNDPAARRRLTGVFRGRTRSRDVDAEPAAPASPSEPPAAPVLSVVVPVYNVAPFLAECLDSVLGQSLVDLEVIAVDDGSTDDSPQILERYAAADDRLRVIRQANGGLGSARNTGLGAARGEFLTFCDSDDTVPTRAFELMVRTLRRSGSDLVVGAARRFKHGRMRQVAWGSTVHEFDRIATTIDEFPEAIQDIVACNRMFRTEFWRSRIGDFSEGIAYEDHVPMLAAYLRAERFDVLSNVTYHWRIREDHSSIGQQKALLQNLRDRVAVKEEAYDLLQAEASAATYDAWVGRCLDIDFRPFLAHALTGTAEYRSLMAATYRTFLDRASERALRAVRHDRLVRAWLCAGEHWEALAEAEAAFAGDRHTIVRVDGARMSAVPDLPASVVALVPESAWELTASETALRAALRSVRLDEGAVVVAGYALVPGLAGPGVLTATLVRTEGAGSVALTVTPATDPAIDDWAEDPAVSHAAAGFAAVAPLADLVPTDGAPATWRLRLRLEQGEIVREAGVHVAVDGSGADRPRQAVVELDGGPVRVEPRWESGGGFEVTVLPAAVVVEELLPPTDGVLRGRLRTADPAGTKVAARGPSGAVSTMAGDDGNFAIGIDGEAGPSWVLRARVPGGRMQPLLWPAGADPVGPDAPGGAAWRPTPDGRVEAVLDGRSLLVERIDLEDGSLVVRLRTAGLTEDDLATVALTGRHADLPGTTIARGPGSATVRFDLGATAQPGGYAVVVHTGDGLELEARADEALAAAAPWSHATPGHRATVRLRQDQVVAVRLEAPLDDEERSPAFRHARQLAHRRRDVLTPPGATSVLLEGGDPDARTALTAALTAARPEVSCAWSDPDRLATPPGAGELLQHSRGWYDALDRAPVIWAGDDLPDFFVKAPWQRTAQLFPGFPVRPVGRSAWQARGMSEHAVQLEIARRRRQWDVLVAPSEDVADIYRREYEYDGRVLVTGLPRTDDLVTRDPEVVRRGVLGRLGVPVDRVVVLHVRSQRDRATRAALLRAGATDELDVAGLARGLGPGHVILTVGVPHTPSDDDEAATVVDVSAHRSLNDLLLTADVAVLDYTDRRFDWALTAKPAIFHVPDHDAYLAAVPAPIDFDATTHGPHLVDTDSVVDAVRDRDRVGATYAAATAELNRTFNALHDGRAAERVVAALLE